MPHARSLHTSDGLRLEGEVALADEASAAAVLCHPHPQFGGSMRSLVTSELFRNLPGAGVSVLRFNFRGVEGSEGGFGGGVDERLDAVAGLDALVEELPAPVPVILAGWSFGADVVLSVDDARVAGWLAVAPPLHFAAVERVAHDPRPKRVVLAEHDEYRRPAEIEAVTAGWARCETTIVPGASHYFVGRTDRVLTAARELAETVAARS